MPDATPWRRPPRDAATLIVVDEQGPGDLRILLGRRGDAHLFMPGLFVFPGGRVDPADLRLGRTLALDAPILDRLVDGMSPQFGRARAAAVALAGLRETFEEAGLMIGKPSANVDLRAGSGPWTPFAVAGIAPDISALVLAARAITPPGQVRRYDTRFFCVGVEAVAHRIPFEERLDRELDSLGWFTLSETLSLDLPGITRQVLDDIAEPLRDGTWRDDTRPIPFYRARNHKLVRDTMGTR